jgi:hypothetical protein
MCYSVGEIDQSLRMWMPEERAHGESVVLALPYGELRPEINIGKSVGAKAKNYDIMDLATWSHYSFAEGTKTKNVEVFSGKGTKTKYRNAKNMQTSMVDRQKIGNM